MTGKPARTSRSGFPVEVPFLDYIGARLVSCADDSARTEVDLVDHHHNSFGVAHGGVLMALLDVTMAMAGRAHGHHHDGEPMGLVTIEMKTSFLQPAQGRIEGHGRCIHRTRTMAFCEGEVVDASGRTIARASGTFKYIRQRKIAA